MKKIIVFSALMIPFLLFAQGFNESFDKVKTIEWINNKAIKTNANFYNLSSLKTKCTYTENFFDKNSAATYNFDLANVTFSVSGKNVKIACKSGSCIEYSFTTPTTNEKKNISSFELQAAGNVNDLYKAFLTLRKRVGLQ
ncbi:MAG TPA: hypothetical protein P5050_04550 [Bacteroidia bacterium]|nr:hypothetical protein [Bacteroidia bacterium]HRS58471.1 hypothetical protein [Bacteroidia bacterium]HRU68398.1 hypothetical protein [Bacteroidia bacterium]